MFADSVKNQELNQDQSFTRRFCFIFLPKLYPAQTVSLKCTKSKSELNLTEHKQLDFAINMIKNIYCTSILFFWGTLNKDGAGK